MKMHIEFRIKSLREDENGNIMPKEAEIISVERCPTDGCLLFEDHWQLDSGKLLELNPKIVEENDRRT